MQPTCTAQEFVDSHLKPRRMVVFMKPTCPFCKRTQEILLQYPFKKESLVFVDITVTRNTERVQDYLQQLTGARTVPRIFIGKECIGGCSDLVEMDRSGELKVRLIEMGALQL
ncbi:glutaredoxin-1 [Pipistrellus kuhlii]|uniref:Glutaredoxin-1 n=1 Tax=Pipistrellus kuhlii TaxID=59472 RepID=A0A7J7YW50_PIPKU|nr:glutaredoxin-1 [Pipistrellus kuhlii]XP_036266029.1 glutaredoxin-1 [Pipistrellus kuhlii]KAF6366243.1 glutaredoxin [Pipistrellus kuhlii]